MNKKSKNDNLLTNDKNKKYSQYPFNQMLNIYINNRINYKKLHNKQIKGERSSYRQEVYEELEDETGVLVDTLKNYSTGKSTPPVNTNFDEYKKFAKILGCNFSELLPESEEEKSKRIALLEKIGFNEEIYKILRDKKLNALFGSPIETTYLEILKDLILDGDFLHSYENEIDTNLSKLLKDKNSSDELKNMSYVQFLQFLKDKNIYTIEDMKNTITRSLEKHFDKYLKNKFDNDASKNRE